MDDPVQDGQRFLIGEDDTGHLLSVHGAVRKQDILSEGYDGLFIAIRARIQSTAGDLVRVRHIGAPGT